MGFNSAFKGLRQFIVSNQGNFLTNSTVFSPHGVLAPSGPGPPRYRGFPMTVRHSTLGRTPLDEWSARRRDLYPTTHTYKRQTSLPWVGFELAIACKRAATDLSLRPRGDRSGKVHLHTTLIISDKHNLTDQMPTYLVFKQVHSVMASEFSTVCHAVWQW